MGDNIAYHSYEPRIQINSKAVELWTSKLGISM